MNNAAVIKNKNLRLCFALKENESVFCAAFRVYECEFAARYQWEG